MAVYDEIGGPGAVTAAVDLFYDKVLADPSLVGYFDRVDMAGLREHQRAFITTALGGPPIYDGRDMKTAHQPLGITDADFDAVVGHLGATLTELGVPADTIGTIAGALAPLRADIVA
ncbi:MAG TPA: group 1 truncated hemoglobin [Acidimicrobiia bacterium]|nr:group 1 truncated hemoglobin [Acidimicrobiia bacterium]